MCGIIGATATRPVREILVEGLLRLEYRGHDCAGVVVQNGDQGEFQRKRVSGKVRELVDVLAENPISGIAGLAHTRWATHGVPSENNAHPHVVNGNVALVHNGIIENFASLRADLEAIGCEFTSDTDSEIVAHLVEHSMQQGCSLEEAVWETIPKLEGSYALGIMSKSEPGKIVAVRKGCPLVVGVGSGENFIASDVLALRSVTDQFMFLDDGEVAVMDTDGTRIFDSDRNEINRNPIQVREEGDAIDKGEFRHYLDKEIHEQPQAIRNTLEGRITEHSVLERGFGLKVFEILQETKALAIVGCGTSYYAACVARYWIEDMAQIPCIAEIASEFRYRKAVVPEGSLFLSLSQSGESFDTIAALRIAEERGYAHTMNIGNVETSTLMRISESAIPMRAGQEISVASTKSFTTMLVDLLLLCLVLARRNGFPAEREASIVEALHELDDAVNEVLALNDRMRELATEFVPRSHALFLGRGVHFPVALEGALKLKEISYMHAEGYPAGELKHGPLALVDKNMPVVALAPNNELLRKVESNLQEVRSRGGKLYVFTDKVTEFDRESGVTVIEVPKVHPVLSPIVYTIPLQLLAYHVAVLRGTDIDQPRNIAKSVTVE